LTIVFLARARTDLENAALYLQQENPRAAVAVIGNMYSMIERLAAGEFEGTESTLRTGQRVRSWPVAPYRIFYQRHADTFRVIRIYHQARRPITR
jgi:toxin ParE1/3/4